MTHDGDRLLVEDFRWFGIHRPIMTRGPYPAMIRDRSAPYRTACPDRAACTRHGAHPPRRSSATTDYLNGLAQVGAHPSRVPIGDSGAREDLGVEDGEPAVRV